MIIQIWHNVLVFLYFTLMAINSFSYSEVYNSVKIAHIGNADTRPIVEFVILEEDKISEYDLNLLAVLVHAEAGNQDLNGKRYVVDVVLNRVESDQFPNTIEEVIYQNNQFSVIKNGSFEKAKKNVTEEDYQAVLLEYEERLNYDILYFGREKSKYAANHFKYQDHWFGW